MTMDMIAEAETTTEKRTTEYQDGKRLKTEMQKREEKMIQRRGTITRKNIEVR